MVRFRGCGTVILCGGSENARLQDCEVEGRKIAFCCDVDRVARLQAYVVSNDISRLRGHQVVGMQ